MVSVAAQDRSDAKVMGKRRSNSGLLAIPAILFCAPFFVVTSAQAQIAKIGNDDGRTLFVNAEPPTILKLTPRRSSILLPSTTSITGRSRPAMNLDRDAAETLVS